MLRFSAHKMAFLQPNLLPLRSDFPRPGYLPVSGLLAFLIATLACCGGLFEGIFKAKHWKWIGNGTMKHGKTEADRNMFN